MRDANMENMVSVIIPVYQVEKYIRKCINSVINQTYQNIEILLIDDGSPDNSGRICDEYALKDNRVKVIHKKNEGVSSARNMGLDICCGEYIMFLDSDDYIAEDAVEKALNALVLNQSDICVFNVVLITEDGEVIDDGREANPIVNEIITADDFYKKFREGNCWYYIISNKLYRRKIFEELRYPVGKIHEDSFVIHNIIDRSQTTVCIDDKLYYYVQTKNSIMRNAYSAKRLDDAEATLERSLFFLQKNKIDELQYALNLALYILNEGYLKLDRGDEFVKERFFEIKKQFRSIYLEARNTKIDGKTKIKIMLYLAGILPILYSIKKSSTNLLNGNRNQ